MPIKDNNTVEKSNALNTLMCSDMGLTELRFFCIYLSKLNARNAQQRTVDVSIREFEDFFGVKLNTTLFTRKIRNLIGRTVEIKENGKIKVLTLYSEFCWSESKPSTITITCNDKMLPYIFELRKNYTNYTIGNIAKLTSVQKIRLYEILKQYEKIGSIKIELEELVRMVCCNGNPIFKDFRKNTLEPAIKDINEHTDIKVDYTKNLVSRKVVALTFNISRKKRAEVVSEPKRMENNVITESTSDTCPENPLESLYLRCNKEYTLEQLFIMSHYITGSGVHLNVSIENYIYSVYYKIKVERKNIKNLYKYTFSIIEKQVTEHIFSTNDKNEKEVLKRKRTDTSYDINEFKNLVEVHEVKS